MRLDIVVPAHNEQHRIDRMLTAYRSRIESPSARFIVAMDRCTDGTQDVVSRHAKVDSRVEAVTYPKLGKGGVIMETLRRCDGDVLAFVDADCATPPVELLRLVDALDHADVAIATRWHPASVVPARRSLARRASSAGFAWGVRHLFGLPYRDTQCGAKVVRRDAAEALLPLLSSRDFLFDVDLLVTARSKGMRIVEVPTVWVDQAGSRLHAGRDARRMALSALRLWLHNRVLPIPGEDRPDAPATIDLREGAGDEQTRDRRPERRPASRRSDVTLISPYPDATGGARSGVGWYTQQLSHALAAQGAEVTVVAPRQEGSPDVQIDGGVLIRRPFDAGSPHGLAQAAKSALATGAPVVHLQHEVFLYGGPLTVPAALPTLAALRAAGRGPVLTMHQVVDPREIDRGFTDLHRVRVPPGVARLGLGSLQQALAGLARATVVHEPAFLDVIPGAQVVHLGANLPAAEGDGAAMRAAWSLSPDDFVVLCFGFVAPYKGLETLLEAAEIAGRPVRVVVAGDEHPRLAGQGYLAALKERYSLSAVFTGYVDQRDVSSWFAAADVVAVAYPRVFSSSGVLSLGVAHGTPLLLSHSVARVHGAPPEMAVDLDPVAVAARLDYLRNEPGQLAAAADATARMHLAGRTWSDLAQRHLELYEEVTDAQSRAGRRNRHRPDRGKGDPVGLLGVASGIRGGADGGALGEAGSRIP